MGVEEVANPQLFQWQDLVLETANGMRPEIDELFRGSLRGSPGMVFDCTNTLAIGSLGPDVPIVLYYGESDAEPQVCYFADSNDWMCVADSVAEFRRQLDL